MYIVFNWVRGLFRAFFKYMWGQMRKILVVQMVTVVANFSFSFFFFLTPYQALPPHVGLLVLASSETSDVQLSRDHRRRKLSVEKSSPGTYENHLFYVSSREDHKLLRNSLL